MMNQTMPTSKSALVTAITSITTSALTGICPKMLQGDLRCVSAERQRHDEGVEEGPPAALEPIQSIGNDG